MRRMLLPVVAFAITLSISSAARAQTKGEVTLIAPGGIRAAVEKLIPGFEKKTGYTVNATFGSGGGAKQQVVQGDVFDVPIVQPPYPDVIASGNVVESSATPLASVAVGVCSEARAHPDPISRRPKRSRKCCYQCKIDCHPGCGYWERLPASASTKC